ncbi:MAG: choice-of-anchor D domain-containing protein, partial [Planctomycetota bacterium]
TFVRNLALATISGSYSSGGVTYAGGATIDTNGVAVTIPQSLLAPSGNGVAVDSFTSITGLIGAPYVLVVGTGTGATAQAIYDSSTGSMTGITVTNPGSGYTGTPTFQIFGGGLSGTTTVNATTFANTSGGLTKINSGTLTLSGTNTYTGQTTVNGGVLAAGIANAFGSSAPLAVNSGTVNLGGFSQSVGALSGSAGTLITTSTGAGSATLTTTFASGTFEFVGSITNNVSGTVAFTKAGAGTLTLNGVNSYTGATTVTAGQLQIGSAGSINTSSGITINGATAEFKYNSATALTKPITFTAGTLSGTGTIGTAVTVGTSDILSPGNSPGSQSFTSGLTFAPGGKYVWEINNWTSGSAGTNYDQLVVSGSVLDITAQATSGSTFTIALTSLTAGNVAGAVPGFSGTAGTSFTIATSSAGITGFDKSKFSIDQSAFTNTLPTNAGFWLSTNGGSTSLILNYAPSATYNLSAAASATAIRVGGTSTITATVTSSTAALTNPDTMSYAGLALSGSAGALSSTSGTLNPGGSSSGNVAFIPVASGSVTFSPSVTSATNVNIATSANAGTTSGVTVSVYNPASANSPLSAVSLGNVYASGTFGTQALSIWNTGTAAAAYQEGLAAAVNGTSGQATGSGSFTNLFTSSTSTAISVGLGGNASTGSAGVKSGTVTLGFTSTGTTSVGATGLSPLTLSSQDVAVTGTVWNPAAVNTITSPVSLGNVRVSGTFGTQALSIQNTAASGSYTEVLGATGSTSGLASLTGSVTALAGGGTSSAISVGLSGAANTTTAGVKSGSATVSFTSTGGPGTAVINSQTVAISGTVWNPAAANSISGTINLGTVLKGTSLSQALSISNTAPADGYSEKLDAAFGTLTGVATTNSSSISLLAAGGTSTAMSVGLDTSAAGSRSGAVDVAFTSNGLDTSGLGTLSLAPQTVNLTATVLDPATALLVGGSTSGSNWLINLGEFNQGSGTSSPFSFGISNLSQTAGFTADLFMASFLNPTSSGAIFTDLSGTSSFATLGAGGTNSFSAWMSLATTGTFTNVYNLSFNSSKNGTNLGGTPQNVTLTVTGIIVVPEPGAIALAGIGIAAAAWALRRRK